MLHGARKNDRQIEARYVKINFLRTIFEMALAPFHFEIFNSLKFNEIMDVGKIHIIPALKHPPQDMAPANN
jgi:hypothetical protein